MLLYISLGIICLLLLLLVSLSRIELFVLFQQGHVHFDVRLCLLGKSVKAEYEKRQVDRFRLKIAGMTILRVRTKGKNGKKQAEPPYRKENVVRRRLQIGNLVRKENLNLAAKLLGCFKNPRLNGELFYGLADPFYTALVFGIQQFLEKSFVGMLGAIRLTPVFDWRGAEGELTFGADFIPLQLAWRSYPVYRAWRRTIG